MIPLDCRCRQLILAALLLVGFCTAPLAQVTEPGGYTDKLYLKNGDIITGKVKGLERGKLAFKTRTMDTVYVNWVDIESIDSNRYLRVELNDGELAYGTLAQAEQRGTLVLNEGDKTAEFGLLDVATIQPIRVSGDFFRRLEGDVKLGLDYKKANDLLLVNLASKVRYREPRYEISLGADWNETTRGGDNNTSRLDINAGYTRFLDNQWFWKASTGFERNEELGLDLRTIVNGTAGRILARTSTLSLGVSAGLAGNWEDRLDEPVSGSAEGLVRGSLDIYKLNIPITRLSARLDVFPGITEAGRLRINSNISLRNEIIESLFWDLSFYSTFDNRPPEGASSEDYGVVTSIGASF
jgi:hypothetical protein